MMCRSLLKCEASIDVALQWKIGLSILWACCSRHRGMQSRVDVTKPLELCSFPNISSIVSNLPRHGVCCGDFCKFAIDSYNYCRLLAYPAAFNFVARTHCQHTRLFQRLKLCLYDLVNF